MSWLMLPPMAEWSPEMLYRYRERLAICEDAGVSPVLAEELARDDAREAMGLPTG